MPDRDELLRLNESLRREIAERRRVEEVLKRSQESFAAAQRIAHLGNWDWDIVSNELVWSEEIYRIFGLADADFGVTYEAFLAAVHPDDREFVQESVRLAFDLKGSYQINLR